MNRLTMSQLYSRKLKNYPYVIAHNGEASKEKIEYEVVSGSIFRDGYVYKRGHTLKLTELQANTCYKNMVKKIHTAPAKKSKPEKTKFKKAQDFEVTTPAGDQILDAAKK